MHTLLKKRAIRSVDPIPIHFVSNIFTRPKKSGGLRTIINLKTLYRHLKEIHFKMEHVMTILPLIKKDMCMTSLDHHYLLLNHHGNGNTFAPYGMGSYMNINAFVSG